MITCLLTKFPDSQYLKYWLFYFYCCSLGINQADTHTCNAKNTLKVGFSHVKEKAKEFVGKLAEILEQALTKSRSCTQFFVHTAWYCCKR